MRNKVEYKHFQPSVITASKVVNHWVGNYINPCSFLAFSGLMHLYVMLWKYDLIYLAPQKYFLMNPP